MSNKIAGKIYFKVDGHQYHATGSFSYGLGGSKKETMSTSDHEHFFKEKAKVPFIEGEIIDKNTIDVATFLELDGVTVTAELANGKSIVLRDAWQVGEGDVNGEEGKIPFRFEGKSAEEVK
jgi:predicted heme/steroid binding protein